MKATLFISTFVVLSLSSKLNAQDYYPLEIGNQWVYHYQNLDINTPPDTSDIDTLITVEVINDTLINDKRYFILSRPDPSSGTIVRVDSSGIIYFDETASSEVMLYKLNAEIGETWTVVFNGRTHRIKLISAYTAIYFDAPTTLCEFAYQIEDTEDQKRWVKISKEFGIVYDQTSTAHEIIYDLVECTLSNHVYTGVDAKHSSNNRSPHNHSFNVFPNPFNVSTKIIFAVNESSTVDLLLFNSMGQRLETLYSGKQSAGSFWFTLDGDELASGIYYVQLIIDGYSPTRRCLLIK